MLSGLIKKCYSHWLLCRNKVAPYDLTAAFSNSMNALFRGPITPEEVGPKRCETKRVNPWDFYDDVPSVAMVIR